MTVPIANVHQLKRHIGIPPDTTIDDDRLFAVLQAATTALEGETRRALTPQMRAIVHVPLPGQPREIVLRDDLLTLTGMTDAVGDVPFVELSTHPEVGPASLVRRADLPFIYGADGVTVTGIWGYHNNPNAMWATTGDSLTAAVTATSTTFTVTDADAPMSDGQTPRFAVGQLLRVADEFILVMAVDTVANSLTVERAVNGTTAAAHTSGTALDAYRPPYDITASVLMLAAWLYRQPDRPANPAIP
ncbi:MAG: hypothetical protein AAF125_07185, partial [Chloroflexota bacterium]